jgi:sporulation protein YlmC with PRC-barrel domain
LGDAISHLDTLPRLSELTGRKMVSYGGRLLGTIEDALIDERDGRIVGYPLDANGLTTSLDRLFTLGLGGGRLEYVRADADLRVGAKLVVVPDEAIVTIEEERLPALPEDAVAVPEVAPHTDSRGEPKRRQTSSRRSAMAVRAAPPVEIAPPGEAPITPPVEGYAPHDDVDDTSRIAVPGGRHRQASSVG